MKRMTKSKLIRNIIISIPLLTTNCLVVIKHPTYIVKDIQNKINIILIDSQCYGGTLEYENKLIIDRNLDEFMI